MRRRLVPFEALARSDSASCSWQPLDLLEHLLELVLGARELARERRDVTPAGQPQVAHDEVRGVVADARDGEDVLGRARQQLAERVALDQLLHRIRRALLGVLVEAPDVLGGIRSLAHPHSFGYRGLRERKPRTEGYGAGIAGRLRGVWLRALAFAAAVSAFRRERL